MQVWGLITVPGDEVDFPWPGAHQKEKVCTEIERLSLAPALKTATAVPENSREPNQTLKCQCQNGEKHPAPESHRLWLGPQCCYTATCCSRPTHAPDYQPLGLHLYFSPPGTPYTNAIHWISVYPSSPAQMSFYLRSFPWMISSKMSISLQMYL